MRDPRPMYFVWEPSDLPIYPYKVYVRSEAHMFCKGCRAPESPCILYGGPCILYGELKQELKVVVGTVDLAHLIGSGSQAPIPRFPGQVRGTRVVHSATVRYIRVL